MGCFFSHPGDAEEKKAVAAYKKYKQSSDSHDLQSSIVYYREAANARRSFLETYVLTAVKLANTVREHYEGHGKLRKDLEEVIALYEEVLNIWNTQDPKPVDYPILLVDLGNAYRDLFYLDKTDDVMRKSTSCYEQARNLKSSQYAEATLMFGTVLWKRCELQKHDRRLNDAIKYLREAYSLLVGSPSAPTSAYNLAGAYLTLSTMPSATPTDFDYAIEYYQVAIKLYQPEHPHYDPSLSNLCQAIVRRYHSRGHESDLDDAENSIILAKEVVPDEFHPKLDETLDLIRSMRERRRDKRTRGTGTDGQGSSGQGHASNSRLNAPDNLPVRGHGQSKKKFSSNLQSSGQGAQQNPTADGSRALALTIPHTTASNEGDGQATATTRTQSSGTTFLSRGPNTSTTTHTSYQGISQHKSTDNLGTSNDATSGDVLLSISLGPPGAVLPPGETNGRSKNVGGLEQNSTTGHGSERSSSSGQNTSRQKSRDSLRNPSQVAGSQVPVANHTLPLSAWNDPTSIKQSSSISSCNHQLNDPTSSSQVPSQGSLRQNSKGNLRAPNQGAAGHSLGPGTSTAAVIKSSEKNTQDVRRRAPAAVEQIQQNSYLSADPYDRGFGKSSIARYPSSSRDNCPNSHVKVVPGAYPASTDDHSHITPASGTLVQNSTHTSTMAPRTTAI